MAQTLRSFLTILAFAGAALPAWGECLAPEAIPAPTGAQSFVQTRQLAGVKKPIVSRGAFEVKGEVIVWTVSEPLSIVTRISPAGVTQSVEGGPDEPLGAGAGDSFLSETGLAGLLKGDLSGLDRRYTVVRGQRAGAPGWRIELTPKSASLSPYIKGLTIEGCQRIDLIRVTQANSDAIDIRLATGPAA